MSAFFDSALNKQCARLCHFSSLPFSSTLPITVFLIHQFPATLRCNSIRSCLAPSERSSALLFRRSVKKRKRKGDIDEIADPNLHRRRRGSRSCFFFCSPRPRAQPCSFRSTRSLIRQKKAVKAEGDDTTQASCCRRIKRSLTAAHHCGN